MSPVQANGQLMQRSVPRASGDEPQDMSPLNTNELCSPRERG